jgi:hypothetical protein
VARDFPAGGNRSLPCFLFPFLTGCSRGETTLYAVKDMAYNFPVMFNSTILDVVIGLIFVYLLLAIICSTINEWIASKLELRAKNLRAAIGQLLDCQSGSGDAGADANWFLEKFYKHPLIAGMHDQREKTIAHPSYLPSRAFATAVMDIVTPATQGALNFDQLEAGIMQLPEGDVRKALLAVIQNADRDIKKAQKNIETWFDDTMERVGGWYKSKMQLWTVLVAACLTFAANADTLRMTHILWINPTQRSQIVESAKVRIGDSTGAATAATKHELSELDDLIGWGKETYRRSENYWINLLFRILGWFLTIVAVSLGAPFWFDLLNKIVNLRNAGRKPETAEQNAAASPPQPPPTPVRA